MTSIAIDLLIDLFLFLFPISFLSREMHLNPKRISDLKQALQKLGFRKIPLGKFLKQAILIFAALAIVSIVLSYALTSLQMNDLAKVSEGIRKIKEFSPILLIYVLIVRVSMEEVFFRGFLVNRIGILLSTALFAAMHALYYSYAEVIGAFVLGLILAFGFKKTQCIYSVIAAHILYNIFALSFIYGGI